MRQSLLATLLILTISACPAVEGAYWPPTSAGDHSWETLSPDSLGIDSQGLGELDTWLAGTNSRGFMILYRGRIVHERYFGLWTRDTTLTFNSVSKTMVATMLGIAQERGLLSIEDPVSLHLGQGWSRASAEQEAAITLRNLMAMDSGLGENMNYLGAPGSFWYYNTPAYLRSHMAMAAAMDLPHQAMAESLLLDAIGMHSTTWVHDNARLGGSTRDMARFGLLLLSGGHWGNRPVLGDLAFLDALRSPSQERNGAYGYLTWLCDREDWVLPNFASGPGPMIPAAPAGTYAAMGKDEKRVYVVPSHDLVVVRHGWSAYASDDFAVSAFDNDLWTRLAPIVAPLAGHGRQVRLQVLPSHEWAHTGQRPGLGTGNTRYFRQLRLDADQHFQAGPPIANQ